MALIMRNINKPLLPKVTPENTSEPEVKKQSEIVKSKILFDKWRYYRILAALVGSLSIIPGIIDYEMRYKQDRQYNICIQDEEFTLLPRYLMLIFSYTAILLLIPYRIAYLK